MQTIEIKVNAAEVELMDEAQRSVLEMCMEYFGVNA